MKITLARLLRRLAAHLEPSKEQSNVEFLAALGRERAREYGDEVERMLKEREAELRQELAEMRGKRLPTRFTRGLRVVR